MRLPNVAPVVGVLIVQILLMTLIFQRLAFRYASANIVAAQLWAPKFMHDAIAIHGHDIIDLVSQHPNGVRLSQLMEIVSERYGQQVTFHTCSAAGMDLDGLLHFLEAKEKVRITSGVVYTVGSPACEH